MFFEGGGFPFGGGFPGGEMPGQQRRKPVDTQEFYTVLGVDKSQSCDQIKKAYRKLAVRHHPDKGGDVDKFKQIQEAAQVLTDEKKREIYDQYGKDGVEQMGDGEGGGGGMDDILSAFFGGRGGPQRERRKQIAPIQKKVEVELADLYCGRSFTIPVERKRSCTVCNGTGTNRPNASTECDECNGQGIQIVRRRMGPGMVQQMRVQCNKCEGTGTFIPAKLRCKICQGEKLMTETKRLTVDIQKGMQHGEKIVFREEGHCVPDIEPGDVVVILVCQAHPRFVRKGNDLLCEFKVSLVEALSPKNLYLRHMDERLLCVERNVNPILRPGMVIKIDEEGMPKPENPMQKGDLFLRVGVEFPESLPADVSTSVMAALSDYSPNLAGEPDEMQDGDEEPWHCSMHQVDITQFGKKTSRGRQAYDDDDENEEAGDGNGMQCQQM